MCRTWESEDNAALLTDYSCKHMEPWQGSHWQSLSVSSPIPAASHIPQQKNNKQGFKRVFFYICLLEVVGEQKNRDTKRGNLQEIGAGRTIRRIFYFTIPNFDTTFSIKLLVIFFSLSLMSPCFSVRHTGVSGSSCKRILRWQKCSLPYLIYSRNNSVHSNR